MMRNNKLLVTNMVRSGTLTSPNIIRAFEMVDRRDFVKPEYLDKTYDDTPLPIGYGQTISQPTTVAFMLERLQPVRNEHVLDVGSGSGWTTALLSFLVGSGGKVIGVERISELVKFGTVNVRKYSYSAVEMIEVEKDFGYEQGGPYDKILVSAAAQEVPKVLIDQLKIGGVMVLPVKSSIYKVTKTGEGEFEFDEFYGFSFVPLVRDTLEDSGEESDQLI